MRHVIPIPRPEGVLRWPGAETGRHGERTTALVRAERRDERERAAFAAEERARIQSQVGIPAHRRTPRPEPSTPAQTRVPQWPPVQDDQETDDHIMERALENSLYEY